jgi:two-component system alkaline phosphatase synthesis response regulator PhoP
MTEMAQPKAAGETARILLIEDESHLAGPLQFNLEQEGYEVHSTASGKEALALLKREKFDLIILDLTLEELDGLEVARQVRRRSEKLPILMLTARSTEQDRVIGLKLGADDYMVKPFHLPELLLRIGRMLQRSRWYFRPDRPAREVKVAGYHVDLDQLRGRGPRGNLELTALEADLLELLTAEPNTVHSRAELLERVWGYRSDVETRTIDNFIVRLRRYFEKEPEQPVHFISVRGRGYMYIP